MDTGADGEPVGRDQFRGPIVTDLRLAGQPVSGAGKGWELLESPLRILLPQQE